ncbi:hypothetical protein AVEN_111802-1, partial [Araneus ventricosus]
MTRGRNGNTMPLSRGVWSLSPFTFVKPLAAEKSHYAPVPLILATPVVADRITEKEGCLFKSPMCMSSARSCIGTGG